MSAPLNVTYGIGASFSSDASQEKTAGKCEKEGRRHLAHLDQLSMLFHSLHEPYIESKEWHYLLSSPEASMWVPGS